MLPQHHFLYGLVLSLILFPFLRGYVLIFLAATVLIDFDHYLIYAIKNKDISLKNAYVFLKNLEKKQRNPDFKSKYTFFLCIFHTYEFLLIVLLFSFFNQFVLLLFFGFISHLVIDIVSTKIEFNNKYFLYYLKSMFFAYYIISKDKKTFGELKKAI